MNRSPGLTPVSTWVVRGAEYIVLLSTVRKTNTGGVLGYFGMISAQFFSGRLSPSTVMVWTLTLLGNLLRGTEQQNTLRV